MQLRAEGSSNKTLNPKATPYWSSAMNTSLRRRSFSTVPSRSVATDFASAARKMASQEPSIWKYDRNGSSDARQVLEHSSGQSKSIYGDRLQRRGSPLTSPIKLGAGGSIGNILEAIKFKLILVVWKCIVQLYALILSRWQQICILRSAKKLVIMHVCRMHTLNRYVQYGS